MFNELLKKPESNIGFNSLIVRKESKRKYICFNGKGVEEFSGAVGGNTFNASEAYNFFGDRGIVTVYNVANSFSKWAEFATSSAIKITGYKRAWIDWSIIFNGGSSLNHAVFYVNDSRYGGNYFNSKYYIAKVYASGSFFERRLDYIDLVLPNPNLTYYIGVVVGNTGGSAYPNEATALFYNIYLEG